MAIKSDRWIKEMALNHNMIEPFQAEDGIRDRSPSRGLGDVYKRQREHRLYQKIQSLLRLWLIEK